MAGSLPEVIAAYSGKIKAEHLWCQEKSFEGRPILRNGQPFVTIIAEPQTPTTRKGFLEVDICISPGSYQLPPPLEAQRQEGWAVAVQTARSQAKQLYDGSIALTSGYSANGGNRLGISLAPGRYSQYLFSRDARHLTEQGFAKTDVANPLGVCSAVIVQDQRDFPHIIYNIRRGSEIYTQRFHAFGGIVAANGPSGTSIPHPIEHLVIGELQQTNELGIDPSQCLAVNPLGFYYDDQNWHPELGTFCVLTATKEDILSSHPYSDTLGTLPLNPKALHNFLTNPDFSWVPTGWATLLGLGRFLYGKGWQERVISTIA